MHPQPTGVTGGGGVENKKKKKSSSTLHFNVAQHTMSGHVTLCHTINFWTAIPEVNHFIDKRSEHVDVVATAGESCTVRETGTAMEWVLLVLAAGGGGHESRTVRTAVWGWEGRRCSTWMTAPSPPHTDTTSPTREPHVYKYTATLAPSTSTPLHDRSNKSVLLTTPLALHLL